MTLSKLILFTISLLTLFACNQGGKQSETIKTVATTTIDTATIDTAKPAMIKSIPVTKEIDSLSDTVAIEDKIIDTIFKLPEVKEWGIFLEKQTKGKRHLKIWIADTPDLPGQKYYWIKAGEDNGTNLVSQFNFYVYPVSMKIMYLDTAEGTELTLEEWRETQKGL